MWKALWRIVGPDAWLWELSVVAWLMLASYILSAQGHLDWTGHAVGRDFVNVWTAGHLVMEGKVAEIFHPDAFLADERRLFDPDLPFHFWSYPPPTLFLVAPLGLTSYFVGYGLWSVAGIAALVAAIRLWTAQTWARLLIVVCPATPTNLGLGQNGAFSAALLIAGLMSVERRPRLAGVLFGLLAFKPQIGILLPIAVIAGRRWTVLAWAAGTAAGVVLLSAPVFGLDAWRGFLGPTLYTQSLMLKQGHGPFMWMMPSAYMAGRVMHLDWLWSAALQAPFTLLAAVVVWRVWRREGALELKVAIAMTATFVATPQAFNYDLIPTAAAALWLWRNDHRSWIAIPLAMLVWALPVTMMGLQYIHVAIAPLILTALLLRLWALTGRRGDYSLSRVARASTSGQLASNT